jgi:hypothetical protein
MSPWYPPEQIATAGRREIARNRRFLDAEDLGVSQSPGRPDGRFIVAPSRGIPISAGRITPAS